MTHESDAVVPSWGQVSGAGWGRFSRISGRAVQLLCKLAPLLAGLLLAVDCAQLLRGVFCDLAVPAGGDWLGTALELLTAWLSRSSTAQPANRLRTIASSAGRCWLTLCASASWLCARARLCSLRDANLAGFQPK
jgi:hypothetical protein